MIKKKKAQNGIKTFFISQDAAQKGEAVLCIPHSKGFYSRELEAHTFAGKTGEQQ